MLAMESLTMSIKQEVLREVQAAAQAAGRAAAKIIEENAMANDVPLVQELMKISQRLNSMLPEFNKLRGLK